jgi:hypothetical protein
MLFGFPKFVTAIEMTNLTYEYRLRGLSYLNTDFNKGTINDERAYYNQQLKLGLTGIFAPGIEITAKIQAVGIVSSSFTIPDYYWQTELPQQKKNFVPFLENAYIKITNFNKLPVDFIIGKQPMEYGTGMIISDNGLGLNAVKMMINYPKLLHTEFFAIKVAERYGTSSDFDVNGIITSFRFKQRNVELGYFQELDNTGTVLYKQIDVTKSVATKSIDRRFYSLHISNKDNLMYYHIEYALGDGQITKPDNSKAKIHSNGWILTGALIGERTKLGKVVAKGTLAGSSGGDLIAPDDETQFMPTLRKRFDGMERSGWGEVLGMTMSDTMFDVTQKYYSGFGLYALEIFFTPFYGWDFYLSNFQYSASAAFFPQATKTSFFEQTYMNQKYNIGGEMDMGVKYKHSRYLEFLFSYSRYTPTSFDMVWPKKDVIEMYKFDTICRF